VSTETKSADDQAMRTKPHGAAPPLRRALTPWLLYLATLCSALPIAGIVAAASPQPPGACSGIGWGCSLYGWDAAGFLLLLVGAPYAIVLALAVGALSFLPVRLRPFQIGVASIGLAVPWAAALWLLAA
jgi:hypothetical protein